MYQLVFTNKFRKDVKLLQKRGYDMNLLKNSIRKLEESGALPSENKPHKLAGEYSGYWEAHLKHDWLIIWKVFLNENEIWLTRTGTHSDLF
ncbi:MAG: type II toxin-antitoxin system YafQ family toxin [Bacteroidota bacterium]|nr:type II toxin-antitoxin system YafQ family toxin [Bacteroidota bacterium]